MCAERAPDGPLRRAWARAVLEIHGGAELLDVLRAIDQRIGLRSFSTLVTALRGAERAGIDAALVVRERARQAAASRFARAERLARVAPLKLWATMMLCIAPCTPVAAGVSGGAAAGAGRRPVNAEDALLTIAELLALDLRGDFERQQIFRPVDVELGAGHGQAHQPVDMPLQQRLRAAIAAQFVQLAKTPARKDRRDTDAAGVLRGDDANWDCAARRRRDGADLRW